MSRLYPSHFDDARLADVLRVFVYVFTSNLGENETIHGYPHNKQFKHTNTGDRLNRTRPKQDNTRTQDTREPFYFPRKFTKHARTHRNAPQNRTEHGHMEHARTNMHARTQIDQTRHGSTG